MKTYTKVETGLPESGLCRSNMILEPSFAGIRNQRSEISTGFRVLEVRIPLEIDAVRVVAEVEQSRYENGILTDVKPETLIWSSISR